MNKHQLSRRIQPLHPGYFVGLAVVSSVVCVFALRANNQQMLNLREQVFIADKNNTDVQAPLRALQSYVTTHMNTDLNAEGATVYPPIQLRYTYERLVRQQSDQIAAANNEIYTTAQRECERLNPNDVSGRARIPCIESYVQSHTSKVTPIPDALYKFSFVSPRWSPDVAGWSMVVAVLSALLAVIFALLRFALKRLSK
jgi:hypothetical protein